MEIQGRGGQGRLSFGWSSRAVAFFTYVCQREQADHVPMNMDGACSSHRLHVRNGRRNGGQQNHGSIGAVGRVKSNDPPARKWASCSRLEGDGHIMGGDNASKIGQPHRLMSKSRLSESHPAMRVCSGRT